MSPEVAFNRVERDRMWVQPTEAESRFFLASGSLLYSQRMDYVRFAGLSTHERETPGTEDWHIPYIIAALKDLEVAKEDDNERLRQA